MRNDRLIVALDVPDADAAGTLLGSFGDIKPFVKVGMQLFYAAGPEWVCALKERGHRVFLDLKLHDIPQTVFLAAQCLGQLGADFLTVHIAGGREMLRAAVDGLASVQSRRTTKVLGITQLTSTDDRMLNEEIGVPGTVAQAVARYAAIGKEAGLDGIVCSGWEAGPIKKQFGNAFLTVIPGIRPAGADSGDQKRVTTPEAALAQGADYLVVGRPITRAEHPVAVYRKIAETIEQHRP